MAANNFVAVRCANAWTQNEEMRTTQQC